MAKRVDKDSAAEDYFAQLDWRRSRSYKRIPARGEAEEPKWDYKSVYSKNNPTPFWFNVIIGIPLAVVVIVVGIFWRQALLIVLAIVLVTFGLAKGIDAWNKYLRADDIDDSRET